MSATIIFDIPVARQVAGFLYLTLVPGFVILKLLKLKNLCLAETVVFSVGLSIAFLMFIGLFINELCLVTGIWEPLSLGPLMSTINVTVLIMCFLGFLANKEDFNINISVAKGLELSRILPIVSLLLLASPEQC